MTVGPGDDTFAQITSPEVDGLRRVLCFEPRGHADMYGGFITPPDDDGAHLGVLFWHNFVNVPSALIASGVTVTTSFGECRVDLGWGGALYACLDAGSVGLEVTPDNLTALIAVGREVKAALAGDPRIEHPTDPRLSGVYGTIVYDDLGTLSSGEVHQRKLTIFADGQVDRSPCGSGTAARVAVLTATGLPRRVLQVRDRSARSTRSRLRPPLTARAT